MIEWTTDPVGGQAFTAALAGALLAAPWLFPPRGTGLSGKRRRTIQVLRTLATLALLFAWLRPTLVRVQSETIRPTLLLLLDASRSMTVEDGLDGASRWGATRRMLEASAAQLRKLADNRDVKAFLFARGLTPLPLSDGAFTLPPKPTGEETALGACLADALDAARGDGGDALEGVLVVSDGAQRALPPRDLAPIVLATRLVAEAAPVFAVPVGERSTAARADIAVADLEVSDAAFAGAPLDVGATIRAAGFPNRVVRVRLLWEDADGQMQTVDAQQLTVRQGVDSYPIALRYAPPAPGEWKLSVTADALEGETVSDNNTASSFVSVREGGVRVLYLAGAWRRGGQPGYEQQQIKTSLAASPDIVFERVTINYKQREGRELSDRFAPGAVDVVILDNVDAAGLSEASWRALAEAIESGVGLAMIGGRQSFGAGGHRDRLGDQLPVVLNRSDRQLLDEPIREDVHLPGPLKMIPAQKPGRRHPIVALDGDVDGDPWAELKPLSGANRLGRLKPGATIIATTDGPRPQPLAVVGQSGLGRVFAFAGDSTWQWVLQGRRRTHQRFWRQAVLWLAKKDDDPSNPVYVGLGARRVPAGARLDVTAGVRIDDSEAGANPISYQATVSLPNGSTVELPLPGGAANTDGVFVQTGTPGDYRIVVRALRGESPIGESEARFNVPRRDLELERPAAEPDTLMRLARATEAEGGRTLALEELPTLLTELANKGTKRRREVVSRTTLYDKSPTLLLFAALITAEWLMRRRAGLP